MRPGPLSRQGMSTRTRLGQLARASLQRHVRGRLHIRCEDLARQVGPALETRFPQPMLGSLDAVGGGPELVVDDDAGEDPWRAEVLPAELGAGAVAGHGQMVPRVAFPVARGELAAGRGEPPPRTAA